MTAVLEALKHRSRPARVDARLARARARVAHLPHLRCGRDDRWQPTYEAAANELSASLAGFDGVLSAEANAALDDVLFLVHTGLAGRIADRRAEAAVAQVARHLAGHIHLRRHHG